MYCGCIDAHLPLARDEEADHAGLAGELVDRAQARLGAAERQRQHRLDARLVREDAAGEPAVVGEDELRLDLRRRMQPDLQHRLREHDLHVDPHRVDGAAHQREVAMLAVRGVDVFSELDLVRDASVHVLERQARRMVAERDVARVRPLRRHRLAVAPQHRILDVIEHLGPRVELDVVRVDVDDEVVVELVALDVAPGVGENLARVGARGDLLGLAGPDGRASQ